jgi:hypothetical protein
MHGLEVGDEAREPHRSIAVTLPELETEIIFHL